jgi:hypothetical protein
MNPMVNPEPAQALWATTGAALPTESNIDAESPKKCLGPA